MTAKATHHRLGRGTNKRSRQRGGYLYVAVLFTTLIVAGSIATAISLDTTRLKTENSQTDRGFAIRLAEAELHRVAIQLSSDSNWRDNHTHGLVSSWQNWGTVAGDNTAAVRYQLNDADGNLADDAFDLTTVVAHARFGSAQAAVSVELENGFTPLDVLRYGVTSFDDIQFVGGASLVSERPVQVFDDCKTSSSGIIITPTLECSNVIQVPVRGDIAASAVAVPSFNVVSRYTAIGTEIQRSSLPWRDGSPTIQHTVLSSTQNPYGSADTNGIYWINALGSQITLRDCRIKGTLAVFNASKVQITGAVHWEPPVEGGAILVTHSFMEFSATEPVLSEPILGVNFNPPETPYRETDSNSGTADEFPFQLKGILFTTNDIRVLPTTDGEPLELTGLLIGSDITLFHSLCVHSLDEVLTNVPIGFVDPVPMRFRSGTFHRVPLP